MRTAASTSIVRWLLLVKLCFFVIPSCSGRKSFRKITTVVEHDGIAFHVLNFRFGLIPGLNTISVAHRPDLAFDIVSREFHNVGIFLVYMVGITATVWHLANGIWLFMVDWGIAIGERAQRLTGYACVAFGVVLLLVGINAAVGFIRPGGLLGGIL